LIIGGKRIFFWSVLVLGLLLIAFFASDNTSSNANVVLDGSEFVSVERSFSDSGNSRTVDLDVSVGSSLENFIIVEGVSQGSDFIFSDPEAFIESEDVYIWVFDLVSEDFTISYEFIPGSIEEGFVGKFGYESSGELYEGLTGGEGTVKENSDLASRLNRWITEDKSFWESFLDFIFRRN